MVTATASASAEPIALATATASAASTPPQIPAGPGVTLLDAGAEPRALLRYAFAAGVESMRVDMKLTMSMNAEPSNTTPTIRMDFEITDVVDREGTLSATYVVRRANLLSDTPVDPAQFKSMSDDLKSLLQASGRCVVTSGGLVKEATVALPANVPQSMQPFADAIKDAVRNAASPLPDVPLGLGARWEARATIAMRAYTLEQTSTHTLVGRTAHGVEEDIVLAQTAPSQPMNVAGKLPAAISLSLVSHSAHGRGHANVALERLVPTSRLHLESQTKVMVSGSTMTQSSEMAVTTDTTIKPIP